MIGKAIPAFVLLAVLVTEPCFAKKGMEKAIREAKRNAPVLIHERQTADVSCYNVMTETDCMKMNATKDHPICKVHADGHKFCRKFCGFCDHTHDDELEVHVPIRQAVDVNCYNVMTETDCIKMNSTKVHPICQVHADGHKFCRKFCGFCDHTHDTQSEIINLEAEVPDLTKRQASSICNAKQFNCSAYSCIPNDYVCDTINDCYNDADEKNCPGDCSGPHQFKCHHDGTCISHRKHCDGHPDCIDWSDEANCAEFDCLDGYTHCVSSLECIRQAYRCDGDKDCEDGSDEAGCPANPATCTDSQFHCATGARACVPKSWMCDGDKDCADGSDEQGCTCASTQFKCGNGGCVTGTWKCDGDNDCGDMSDEVNCPEAPSHTCYDILTAIDCMSMNTTSHPICTVPADGHKFCRKFCNMCDHPTGAPVGK